ncbi:hypothetical protein BB560_005056 [Smittium megazygosporum]|uniref:Phospho-2-dehydro-3-deoxyheptonate aldolase n=1 Tax=Smittium megazygosporum TaxID=133381 RepID=A0A2T9Z7I6_9FUNG|nr:hypothetical protein BB560_005056 [Smittium megazygosporum]
MGETTLNGMDDVLVEGYDPLIPPQILQIEYPLSQTSKLVVRNGRTDCVDVITKKDDRLLVIVGPCSIHDPKVALEYAKLLLEAKVKHEKELLILMRVYFEKPRTTVGWKGLINDPNLNNTNDINIGLRKARQLLCSITDMGLPAACELLDTISPQFLGDQFSWGAIGARTTESQLHRELASGVSFPVGFKNGTDGNVNIAIDAIKAAEHQHHFLGVTKMGLAAIAKTRGNPNCHIILRGGSDGPNFDSDSVASASNHLKKSKLSSSIMIDFSHGNSRKNHLNQISVCDDVASQISNGNSDIVGVMIESHLFEGRQDLPKVTEENKNSILESLKYGVSVTDACVSWDQTVSMLDVLAKAVIDRRSSTKSSS